MTTPSTGFFVCVSLCIVLNSFAPASVLNIYLAVSSGVLNFWLGPIVSACCVIVWVFEAVERVGRGKGGQGGVDGLSEALDG
jgi:hypothetical protein